MAQTQAPQTREAEKEQEVKEAVRQVEKNREGSLSGSGEAKRSPEADVPLRWVYSPGEQHLQYRAGKEWVLVPHVTLEASQADPKEKDD